MVGLTVEPRSRIAIVVLLCALIMAVAFAVVRIKAASTVRAHRQDRAPAHVTINPQPSVFSYQLPDRNPFLRPASIGGAGRDASAEQRVPAGRILEQPALQWPATTGLTIKPLQTGPGNALPSDVTSESEPRPRTYVFTLLATVRGGDKRCGVIRVGDSPPRVVEVGDVLEGGFRVKELDGDHALLTNGRETVIVHKPYAPSVQGGKQGEQ